MSRPGPEADVAVLVVVGPEGAGSHAPAPADADPVRRFFAEEGFAVGPLVGIAFTIASDRDLMRKWFPDIDRLEGSGEELSLGNLPQQVRERLAAVTTEAPPELHV
jgi:hypothetical protein